MSPVTSRGYDGEAVRTPSRPAEVNVLVAVAPKYALLAEKRVEEADARVERPVKVGVAIVGDVSRTTNPVPFQEKREEVANEVTFAVAPVLLPRTNPAAIVGS